MMRPAHKVQQVQQRLIQAGWRLVHRSKKTHHQLWHTPAGRQVTLTVHGGHQLDRLEHRYLGQELRRDKRAKKAG